MLDFIFSVARGCMFFYIFTNIYLVIDYLRSRKRFEDINWSQFSWLLIFGFILALFIGIDILEEDWE